MDQEHLEIERAARRQRQIMINLLRHLVAATAMLIVAIVAFLISRAIS